MSLTVKVTGKDSHMASVSRVIKHNLKNNLDLIYNYKM